MAAKILQGIKKIILGNNTDCDCRYCGYPMGRGDEAFEYGPEIYCSRSCATKHNQGEGY